MVVFSRLVPRAEGFCNDLLFFVFFTAAINLINIDEHKI